MFSEWFKNSNIYKEKKLSDLYSIFEGVLLINIDPPLPDTGAFSWEHYSNNKCSQQTVFATVQQLFSSGEINLKATYTFVKCIHIVHES